MKNFIFLFCIIFLSACAKNNIISRLDSNIPPQTIQNTQCEDIPAVEIFQVLDTFSLARACEISDITGNFHCFGHIVYVPKEKNKIYFDEQIIEPVEGKCISYSGVYKYQSANKVQRTVPKLKFINSDIENPAYVQYLKEQKNLDK